MIYEDNEEDPLGMDAPFAPIKEGRSRLPKKIDRVVLFLLGAFAFGLGAFVVQLARWIADG